MLLAAARGGAWWAATCAESGSDYLASANGTRHGHGSGLGGAQLTIAHLGAQDGHVLWRINADLDAIAFDPEDGDHDIAADEQAFISFPA